MKVEVINTGTELLLGEIVNTNFPYLAQKLNELGFDVLFQTTVGDNPQRLKAVIETALSRADIIITSGGLGPTRGDITKDIVCDILGLNTYLDLDIWNHINSFFAKKNICMTANNDKQAMIPIGAEILFNKIGTAPGLAITTQNQKLIVLLPGPPSELKHVCEEQLFPLLVRHYAKQGIILSRTIKLIGIGESTVADCLDDLITQQTNPTLAIYARNGEILIRLTAKCENADAANTLIDESYAQIYQRIGKYIYGTDSQTLPEFLGQELLRTKSTIAFAESCTGGLTASLMTDIPGSSEYVLGSAVTYNNTIKNRLLKVPEKLLAQHGAVNAETACAMATGARELFGSDYAVGITGIAGPGGGSHTKPVGLVYIAVADENGVTCKKHQFGNIRIDNKQRSALAAILMVIEKINEKETRKN